MCSFDIISAEYAPRVIAHYLQYDKMAEVVIKQLISNLRESMHNNEWPLVLEAMQLLYQAVRKDSGLMNLAFDSSAKLASLYGVGDKYSSVVCELLTAGLTYVLEDNYEFVHCLAPFLSRVGAAHSKSLLPHVSGR